MIMGVRMSALCVFLLLYWTLPSLRAENHSLYYIYVGLSKPVDLPGIYQFTAMGLLDDRQIDYYNSKDQRRIPKQTWMKARMQEDYWEKGTQSRKSKERWFHVNVDILMKRMRHNESKLHVLQWRTGCEVTGLQGSEMKFSKGVYEFSYDGEDFLSFDIERSQWVASTAALPTKRKWDNVPMLNQYTKGYLEKECVDWLNKFRQYADEELRNGSSADVRTFVGNCTNEKTKLKLTCLATSFYKDMILTIRKQNTSLPENETGFTQIRPNHDGSYQMVKSVEINEDEEEAEYDCFVYHRSFKEPIINKWERKCLDCPSHMVEGLIGAVCGGLFTLAVVGLVFSVLLQKKIIVFRKLPMEPVEENRING